MEYIEFFICLYVFSIRTYDFIYDFIILTYSELL